MYVFSKETILQRFCVLRRISSLRTKLLAARCEYTQSHSMPVRRLGSGGKSSKFKMALSRKQLLLLYVVIAKSTKTTYQILKTVLGKTNIPNESTIK
jgi:hypothetical protein